MPLHKIDDILSLFVEKEWVYQTKHCKCEKEMIIRLELRILGVLKVIGHNAPFRTLQSDTNISDKEHRLFFKKFINCMFSIKEDYICYPTTQDDLDTVMVRYADNFLPGCGGSVDVVHVKWSNCPAEDVNRAKGKEGFPSLAFKVVTGFDRQVSGVSIAHFGTQNDTHIVRLDEIIKLLRNSWYRDVEWKLSDEHGNTRDKTGVYLICDGGYIRWPELICPYKHEPVSSQKGYFSAKIESVRKDVECVFGIIKKRWRILDYGIRFRDMKYVEKAFTVCCMLHNDMLTEMESRDCDVRVGRGAPLPGDGIWLRGDERQFDDEGEDADLAFLWASRREKLAEHIHYCARRDKHSRNKRTSSSF